MKKSIKELNKSVKKDLKSLLHWVNTDKISLNVTKTEIVIFKAKGKVFDTDLKLKMCGKKFYPSHHVKCVGLYLDQYLNWATHFNQLCVKLVKANVMISKICYFVNETTLRDLSILLSSIPIYLMHVLLGDNPSSHPIEFAFHREMLYG